jgi:mannonate dehydratase
MKIVAADVFVTCPGRNFVTLKITTDEGIVGLGDATLNGRELSVASYLKDHLCPQLIGRDAHRIEDIWQFFYKGAYWRRGPVTMSAISAVDMALWDIKAKAANMPLYQLLGGASREGVMVYCHTTGHTIDDVLEDYARHKEMGFKAIRVQCGVPGMKTTYGMAKGRGWPTSLRPKATGRKSSSGPPKNTSTSRRSCSTRCAVNSASMSIFCTTCTTA